MNKLHKVASKFIKILKKVAQTTPQQPSGYKAILNIYNATKQMKNETAVKFKEDPAVAPKINNIFQNASKFLWNAAYKGITASTSTKYHGLISQGLGDLIAYANSKKSLDERMLARNPFEANIYTTILSSSNKLSNALANFNPVSMPAQVKPKAPEAPYGSIESVPFGPPAPPPPKDVPAVYKGPKSPAFDFSKFNLN